MIMVLVLLNIIGSFGFEQDLFELGVIYFEDEYNYNLTYSTPITNNVIGCLSNEEVMNYLRKIKEL